MPALPFSFPPYWRNCRSQPARESQRQWRPASEWNSVSFVFSEIQKFKIGNHPMNQNQSDQIHGSCDDKYRAIRLAGKIEPLANGRLNDHSADGSGQPTDADNGT